MSNERPTILIGDQEWELRVAIPGKILLESKWSDVPKETRLPAGDLKASDLAPEGFQGPLVIDLGCGNGRFSLLSALARPTLPHIAIDTDAMHLRYLRRRVRERGITNLRIYIGDGGDLLSRLEPAAALEIHAYHPQPWHEPGLAHRRLFHPPFQLHAHRALVDGGTLCVQTDSKPYSNYLRGTLPALFEIRELSEQDAWPDHLGKPRGRRELVATEEGLTIWRCVAIKRSLTANEASLRAAKLPKPTFESDRKASSHRVRKVNRGQKLRG